MKHPRLWFLLALTGLLCIGWAIIIQAVVRHDADEEFIGACLLGLPALLLTLRDSWRAWQAQRSP